MKTMEPGERFNIPADTLDDMDVPLDDPRDRPDARYKIRKLQDWLPFDTTVYQDAFTGDFTFERLISC